MTCSLFNQRGGAQDQDKMAEEEIAKYEDSIATYERELAAEENSFVGYDGCEVFRGTKSALEDTK